MIIGISGKKQHGKDTVCKIIQYLMVNKRYNNINETNWTINQLMNGDLDSSLCESGWQRRLFADKLKDIVCLLIGCTREQLEDPVFKETPLGEEWWYYTSGNRVYTLDKHKEFYLKPGYEYITNSQLIKPTPRLILQLMGTECGRQIIHPNIWVNSLMSEYKSEKGKTIVESALKDEKGYYVPETHPANTSGKTVRLQTKKFEYVGDYTPDWIITDVRFENEVKAIKEKDGIVIRVNRHINMWDYEYKEGFHIFDQTGDGKGWVQSVRGDMYTKEQAWKKTLEECLNMGNDNHYSETALDSYDGFDSWIENSGSMISLINQVKAILKYHDILKTKT